MISFLLYLQAFDVNNVDIIVLSETWNLENVKCYVIPNFVGYYNQSEYNKSDGVISCIC